MVIGYGQSKRTFTVMLYMPINTTLQDMVDYILHQIKSAKTGTEPLHPSNPIFYLDPKYVKCNVRAVTKRKDKINTRPTMAGVVRNPTGKGGRHVVKVKKVVV
jgi:hypothetical protein